MTGYGFFPGGDPRKFRPDPEASTDAERAKHKADCDAWDRGEMPNVNANAAHWTTDSDSDIAAHVIPAGYGLGSYDDDDADDSEPDDEPHPYNAACDCNGCYEARTLARFRGEPEPKDDDGVSYSFGGVRRVNPFAR